MRNSCRSIWLRQEDASNPVAPGKWHCMMLSEIGHAAARETLVTATPHMAAIWTDLFKSLLVENCSSLCWHGNGPGIGGDVRSAYSALLGRYMARAYLTEHEGVHVLVPLDEVKRRLQGTPYVIKKDPDPSDPHPKGLEADCIGLDDSGCLVIVEAKGSFTRLDTKGAIGQAKRTAVFCSPRRKLSAKRWAIASRWGTEKNNKKPTLRAHVEEEQELDRDDYRALYEILHLADVGGVLERMKHPIYRQASNVEELIAGVPSIELRIDNLPLEDGPGFVAIVGPFGVHPLSPRDEDRILLRRLRDLNFSYAIASLSRRYVEEPHSYVEKLIAKATVGELASPSKFMDASERSASHCGLTVVWPHPDENVAFE